MGDLIFTEDIYGSAGKDKSDRSERPEPPKSLNLLDVCSDEDLTRRYLSGPEAERKMILAAVVKAFDDRSFVNPDKILDRLVKAAPNVVVPALLKVIQDTSRSRAERNGAEDAVQRYLDSQRATINPTETGVLDPTGIIHDDDRDK